MVIWAHVEMCPWCNGGKHVCEVCEYALGSHCIHVECTHDVEATGVRWVCMGKYACSQICTQDKACLLCAGTECL